MSELERLPKLSYFEKLLILSYLNLHKGNKTHTARALGIGLRTLQRKLHLYTNGDKGNE